MSFGVEPFGTAPFGSAGAGTGPAAPEVYTPLPAPLRIIVCAGAVVAAAARLRIKIFERYAPTVDLQVAVTPPRYQPSAALRINVFEQYRPALPLAITVSDVLEAPQAGGDAYVWSARVTLGGVDVSARLTGEIEVEAEENAARVAHFSLAPGGVSIALANLARQPVVIEQVRFDAGGARVGLYRLFTGVVDSPEYNANTRVLTLTCSDARQAKLAAMTREQLDALTPGAVWSPFVFDRYALAEQYLTDRLSTLAGAVDGDAWGALGFTAWAGAVMRSFDDSVILDGSLRPRLTGAASARKTRLTLTYRHQQAVVRGIAFWYQAPSLSMQFNLGTRPLRRSAVEQALQGSGAAVVGGINWTPYPAGAAIENIGAIFATPAEAAALCLGATAWLNRRYSRAIDEVWAVEIGSEGTRTDESRVVAVEWDATDSNTRHAPANAVTAFSTLKNDTPIPHIPARTIIGETHVDYVPPGQPTDADFGVAARAAIKAGARAVAESLRGSVIGFSVALDPSITLRIFAGVSSPVVSGAGKVTRVAHRLSIDAGSAITDVELECVSVSLPDVPSLMRPEIPAEIKGGAVAAKAETWFGGMTNSRPWDETVMFGYSGNVSALLTVPGAPIYPEQFSVMVPGIEERAAGLVTVPPTCTMRAGQAVLEALTSTDGFAFDVAITGTGIPANTKIVSFDGTARTATLSNACTESAVEREVRVATRQYIPRLRLSYTPTITRNGPFVGA